MRKYFPPEVFDEVLKATRRYRRASGRVGSRVEKYTGEIPGFPHVILATPKPGVVADIPTATSFDTPDGGWIITSDPPEYPAPLTRFIMLHEIGHHDEHLSPHQREKSIWEMINAGAFIAFLIPLTLSNILVTLAIFWLLMCDWLEIDIDTPANELTLEVRADEFALPANELTLEVRADEFALQRTPSADLPALVKMFSRRYREENIDPMSRTGHLRWQRAVSICQRSLGVETPVGYWRLGTGPAPKFAFVAVPLLELVLSVQHWRWVLFPLWSCRILLAVGAIFFAYQSLRATLLSFVFVRFRKMNAPLKDVGSAR